MSKLEKILEYVRVTNPAMTMERLIEELCICDYVTDALVMIVDKNNKGGTTM